MHVTFLARIPFHSRDLGSGIHFTSRPVVQVGARHLKYRSEPSSLYQPIFVTLVVPLHILHRYSDARNNAGHLHIAVATCCLSCASFVGRCVRSQLEKELCQPQMSGQGRSLQKAGSQRQCPKRDLFRHWHGRLWPGMHYHAGTGQAQPGDLSQSDG